MARYSACFTALASIIIILVLSCGKTEHLQGKSLYLTHCNNCHLEQGQGLRSLIPPLAASDYLREKPAEVVRGIRHGMQGPMEVNGKLYDYAMPGNLELSEFQIVNIVNYLNQAWGNDYPQITVAQTREWLGE